MKNIIKSTSSHIKINPHSIEFENGTSWEEMRHLMGTLLHIHDTVQFYLGDCILFGQGQCGWGDYYTDALKKTDYSYEILRQFAYVAKRFPPKQREQLSCQHDKFSFTRLQEVVSLNDAQVEYLLKRGDEEGWSCSMLREEVKKLKSPAKRLARWWANLQDPIKRAFILATPHIDKKVKGKRVYILTGISELPELDSQP